MCLKTVQKYRSHVCQSPPWTLEALHSLLLQWAPTSHRASSRLSPPRPWFQPWLTSNSSFKMCLILKTHESKNKAWGEGWGHFLKTEAEPSNHLLDLCPLLLGARAMWIWLGTWSHHSLTGWCWLEPLACQGIQAVPNRFYILEPKGAPTVWQPTYHPQQRTPPLCWDSSPVGARLGDRQHIQKTSEVLDIQTSTIMDLNSSQILNLLISKPITAFPNSHTTKRNITKT